MEQRSEGWTGGMLDRLGATGGQGGVVGEGMHQSLDGRPSDLDVELETPGQRTDPEGLVGVARTTSQVDRSDRHLEGVAVPVEDGEPVGQAPRARGHRRAPG